MKRDYFDIHSHINFKDYDKDREVVIERMKNENISTITIGTDVKSSKEAIELANAHENLFACIGLHPADNETERFDEEDYKELIFHPRVVAIGECGLDYGKNNDATLKVKKKQKEDFERQIEFAVKYKKPLMLHCRNAHEEILQILESKKKEYGEKLWGNSHFFSAGKDIAKRYLDIGFSISFTGVITFVSAYDEALRFAPLDMIMSETDAPFVAPVPYRGKRNEPIYVEEVVKRIAEVRKEEFEIVKKTLVSNAFRVFRIAS